MQTTYKAVLRGDRLEWDGPAPPAASAEQTVAVEVTLLDSANDPMRGSRAAAALRAIASTDPFAGMDAAAWERETRDDRLLPGRD